MTEDEYLIWLSGIAGMTLVRANILLDYFGSARDIWSAPSELIYCAKKIPERILENIINSRDEKKINFYIKSMIKNKIDFISRNSKRFPELLKKISDAPLGIYVLGKLPEDLFIKISVIGSRRYSEYGAFAARKISFELAEHDIVIVSGMARGIDSVAHQAAIDACGKTIAVLGCGLDVCYPPENKKLRELIINNGCLISEYPLGTRPFMGNFVVRNRIISGLSHGVIIIEASDKSGTFITVKHALRQNRKVMAVPGLINSNFSLGTNNLIKHGASLVCDYQDVLRVIKNFSHDINKHDLIKHDSKINNKLDKNESLIYDLINTEPVSFEFILEKINLPVNILSATLSMLELKNIIKKLPGQKYVRV